ncbi:MAG TPA: TRAP transporter small permease subunit, partial [Terricaulis sp.]|nr:TRAP transporter small permease subunit [Terricaulis sp.]
MTAFARWLGVVSDVLARIALALSCAALALMLGCMLVQVVSRYLLSEPLAWTEELARYAMVWCGFLGATTAFQRNADPVLLQRTSLPAPLRPLASWL